MAWVGVIVGEFLVSKEGLGYLIMYGSQVFNIDLVITGVFILGIISYIMYYFINKLELRGREYSMFNEDEVAKIVSNATKSEDTKVFSKFFSRLFDKED